MMVNSVHRRRPKVYAGRLHEDTVLQHGLIILVLLSVQIEVE